MKQWSFDVRSWGPSQATGNERAWKDHRWSVAAALLDGLFEQPALRQREVRGAKGGI